MRDSEEGRQFRIRQTYMQKLYRDADEGAFEAYLSEAPANNPIETGWKRPEKFPAFNALPNLSKSLENSYEYGRFWKDSYLNNRSLIASFFETILGRKADKGGLEHFVSKWAVGTMDLSQIYNTMRDSEEFKRRKLDEIEIAYIDCLLRPADAAGLKMYRDQHKGGKSISDIRFDIKSSDEGKKAAVRRLYWRIMHRDADNSGLNFHSDRLIKYKKMPMDRNYNMNLDMKVREIASDLLKTDGAKGAAAKLPVFRDLRADIESAWNDFGDMQLSFTAI